MARERLTDLEDHNRVRPTRSYGAQIILDDPLRPSASSSAPRPWEIEDHTTGRGGYIRIVDANGVGVCELFPFAIGGRGKGATLALARQIVDGGRCGGSGVKE